MTKNRLKSGLMIILQLLFSASAISVNAQYTDYIGAGHNDNVVVTASSTDTELLASPSRLVDGSGLSESGELTSNYMQYSWISGEPVISPIDYRSDIGTWIQFDLGHIYQLAELWAWNFGYGDDSQMGLRDIIIDYSTDGLNWTELGRFEWENADPSQPNFGFKGADFNGINARYIMISIRDNWGGSQLALAEVKFNIGTGNTVAANPYPLDGANSVFKEEDLKWTKANGTGSQQIYLGTSNPPLPAGTTVENTFDPGPLEAGTTYYWRINEGDIWSFTTSSFSATGISDSLTRPAEPVSHHYPNRYVPVEITFEETPTKFRFMTPAMPSTVSENGIHYNIGYCETGDRDHPANIDEVSFSWELISDEAFETIKIWIESQNDARIKARIMGGLGGNLQGEYRLAHDDLPNGTDYGSDLRPGMGDWASETYTFYPDGMHTRHARIYSGRLTEWAAPFHEPLELGGLEYYDPFFEFNEGLVFLDIGRALRNYVEASSVTLVKMSGESTDISFDPLMRDDYPGWYDANIQLINVNAEYDPFVIALPDSVHVKPYYPDGCETVETGCYPNVWSDGYGGSTTPIGHVLNFKHYKWNKSNMISNVYLSGNIKSSEQVSDLTSLANSWVNAPALSIHSPGYSGGSYVQHERGYVFQKTEAGSSLDVTIDASADNPLIRPSFVVQNWGTLNVPEVTMNGSALVDGTDFKHGMEGAYLVIYLNVESTSAVELSIEGGENKYMAPTIELTDPMDEASHVYGDTLTFSATPFDEDGSITSVSFFINDVLVKSISDSPYTFNWIASGDGAHTIYAISTDNDGIASEHSDTVIISISGTPAAPICSITSPSNGAELSEVDIITINASASSDEKGSIASVIFYINDVPLNIKTESPYAFDWRPTAAGDYTIHTVATDNFGVRSEHSNYVKIKVNSINPTSATNRSIDSNTTFKIYPNPASDHIFLDVDAKRISIVNTLGQKVKTITEYRSGQAIDVNSLKKGIYFLSVESKQNTLTDKLILK